jgi:two-component system, cell cycle response regulator
LKILIAEDEAISRRLLKSTLERTGYEVIAVEEGNSAAEILQRPDGPRLALLDWVMPGMDGPAVVRTVRRKREQPYVHMILLTSKQSKEDIVEGLEAGADDYLTKPFDPQELRARLRTGERILQLEDKLVEAREEMRYRATHDTLTSLWNRGMIQDLLYREIERYKRNREHGEISVIMGDVDHFKKVNDTFGHAAGDEVLKAVAARLVGSVRSYDAVSRYGGEEFLIVMTGCDEACGCSRAEQIRKSIERGPVPTNAGAVAVTISLGVAVTSDWEGIDGEGLIRQADAALYQAKRDGRNRVALARPGGIETAPGSMRDSEQTVSGKRL